MKNRSKVEPITQEEWYREVLRAQVVDVTPQPPQGYLSIRELSVKTGLSESHLRHLMKMKYDKGLVKKVLVKSQRAIIPYYGKP
jgi:lambda repressor-like predicted transcriptional regulator